jgi:hypothetical protein
MKTYLDGIKPQPRDSLEEFHRWCNNVTAKMLRNMPGRRVIHVKTEPEQLAGWPMRHPNGIRLLNDRYDFTAEELAETPGGSHYV